MTELEEAEEHFKSKVRHLESEVNRLTNLIGLPTPCHTQKCEHLGMAREAIKEAQEKIEARSREHACAGWQCSECAPADVASGLAEVLSSIPATDGLECNDLMHTWAGATCNDCGKPTKQKESEGRQP